MSSTEKELSKCRIRCTFNSQQTYRKESVSGFSNFTFERFEDFSIWNVRSLKLAQNWLSSAAPCCHQEEQLDFKIWKKGF